MKERLVRIWFCTAQFLTIPSNFICTHLLRLQIIKPENLNIRTGTLIIANHQSKLDPFLISHHLAMQDWASAVPMRYPVTPEYMRGGFLSTLIKLLGGYNIGETPLQRLKGLAFTRELLKKQYSVLIFPEGKIDHTKNGVSTFQRGVEVLFSQNHPVVFARLTGLNSQNKFHFWQSGRATIEYSEYLGSDVPASQKTSAMMDFFGLDKRNANLS